MEDYNQNPYDPYPGEEMQPARQPKPKKKMTLKRRIRRFRKKLSRMSSGSLLILGGGALLVVLVVAVLLIVLLPKKDKTGEPDQQLTISDAPTAQTPTLPPISTAPAFTPEPTIEPISVIAATLKGDKALDLNMESDLVPDIQTRLIELGYMEMPVIDGVAGVTNKYGPATKIAMRIFQYKNELERDGKCGEISYTLLMSQALPAEGGPKAFFLERNDDDKENLYDQGYVAKLQQRLVTLGYFKEAVTGRFGKSTAEAVQKFQADNGLQADGKAGQQTLTLLYSEDAVDALTAQLNKQNATTSPATSTSPDPSTSPAGGTTTP